MEIDTSNLTDEQISKLGEFVRKMEEENKATKWWIMPQYSALENVELYDKYELVDKSGCPIYVIDIHTIDKSHVDFRVWEIDSWDGETNEPHEKEFVADVYWKFDNCTHWNFYGMDYDPENKDNDINPAYYHICGSFFMTRWMIMFAFVRKVMNEILGDTTQDYRDSDKELDKMLLKDYTIRKVE